MAKKLIELTELEKKLVEWFLTTYQSRTPMQTVLDNHPNDRIGWHEVRHQASLLQIPDYLSDSFRDHTTISHDVNPYPRPYWQAST